MSTTLAEAIREPVPAGKHYLAILNESGDTRIIWDPERPAEVDQARAAFDKARSQGHVAYRVDERGEKGEIMRTFDPEAEKVILAPALRGG